MPEVKIAPMWKSATPTERADWVRAHQVNTRNIHQLCRIFSLTEEGAWKILNGDEWRPEYEANPQ